VGLAGGQRPHPRAVIFDLDRALIDSRNAWRYCVEESLAAALNRRLSAADLVEEYHVRPWRDALGVLVEPHETARCADLCEVMFARSAMKKLLVHEGIGMALDALRGEQMELGAISRLPHALAVKQVQSTGLDRFVAVLSATPVDERWRPEVRVTDCLAFLEAAPHEAAFVSGDMHDRALVAAKGLAPFEAGWAPAPEHSDGAIEAPSGLLDVVLRAWAVRGR
jgi:beta-phosphoglucomutase-like phosphatase (HAD superfamily)